jgi:Tfp pilus assembly PilM family ATPase
MLGWMNRSTNRVLPIGLDFGTAQLKVIQFRRTGERAFEQVAAVSIKTGISNAPSARDLGRFFRDSLRPLLDQAGFLGKRAVLALPAAHMHVTRLRVRAWCDESVCREIVHHHALDWLPFPPSHGLIRRIDAGEVYDGHEPSREIILLAMHRELVERYLDAAASARLEVALVMAEPLALLCALAAEDTLGTPARLVIDFGHHGARIYAGKGRRLLFARILHAGMPRTHLPTELRRCRQYIDHTFPAHPLEELVFTGGGARDVELCRKLAEAVGLPARLAEPQMPGTHTDWTLASGLSLSAARASDALPVQVA